MSRSQSALIIRPEPSRGLGAFYRNLGITMVATHLRRRGVPVELVDLSYDSLEHRLQAVDPTVALFSLYIDDFERGIQLAAQLKAEHPRTVTMVGGPHATLLAGNVFQITSAFDVVALGDCLPEAVPMIQALHQRRPLGTDRLIRAGSAAARMDQTGPDYSLWGDGRYFPVFPVEFSRGCRHHCPFCTDPVLRRGVTVDPVDRTMRTLRALVDAHGPVWVRFVDSSLSSLGVDLDRLLADLTAAQLPIQWGAYAYPSDIDHELAERLAATGCRALFLGIESLSSKVRTGKRHSKRLDEVAEAVGTLQRAGIFVHGNFIVGLPGETAHTLEETRDAAGQIGFDSIGGGPFYLTPGSTFERFPQRFGIEILDPHWQLKQHRNFWDASNAYFRTATLTQAEMRQMAAGFRQRVEGDGTACWNLSDYAVLCWQSVGGTVGSLKRLWRLPDRVLTTTQRTVLDVLKEKLGVALDRQQASGFVATARIVAAEAARVG